MNTYTAEFQTDTKFANVEIKANTPQHALAKAQKLLKSNNLYVDLYWEHFDGNMPINTIIIFDEEGDDCTRWQDDHLHLKDAAPALLNFAETVAAGNTEYDRLKVLARAVIAQAKGGAA